MAVENTPDGPLLNQLLLKSGLSHLIFYFILFWKQRVELDFSNIYFLHLFSPFFPFALQSSLLLLTRKNCAQEMVNKMLNNVYP